MVSVQKMYPWASKSEGMFINNRLSVTAPREELLDLFQIKPAGLAFAAFLSKWFPSLLDGHHVSLWANPVCILSSYRMRCSKMSVKQET